MKKLDYYWLSNPAWWHWTENADRVLNDDAPEEAKKSYEHYLEQKKGDWE